MEVAGCPATRRRKENRGQKVGRLGEERVVVRLASSRQLEFLDLEREIENFAMQWMDEMVNAVAPGRWGLHAGLGEQLALIETRATALRKKAFEAFE